MQTRNYILIASFLTLAFWPGNIFAQSNDLGKALPADILNKIPNDLNLTINENSYPLAKSEISTWLKEENYLAFDTKYSSEIENINFCQYEKSLECRLSFPYENQRHIKKKYTLSINADAIKNFVKDLARKVNKDPLDAKFEITDGRVSVFALSSPGIKLDEEKSVQILENYLLAQNFSASLDLPAQKIQPEISSDSQNNLGITSLIGSGKSNFVGSPKNRIFNIKVATNRFNGILIKPGEEFSFVKVLGEVDGEHGYLPELVIKQDKTEPEFGGGICQVSTTAFRVAINSGLEITARRNHAYPVGYYNPQGMDATVYVPLPDLRFINNTPGHILIETKIEGTELIFNFYGTDDGRKTNVIGPTITERKPDGSMKATFTQQVFDKDAKLIREDVFNSAYDSPNKYPHPGAETLTEKPKDWSDNEWKKYKKEHGM
ncbi:MAG: VanW family protein [bacterium]|nr:VanW family protein [bacterium]